MSLHNVILFVCLFVCLLGEALSEAGYTWTGVDIAPAMLAVAVNRDEDTDIDVMCVDIGQGLPFRPASFDGAIR